MIPRMTPRPSTGYALRVGLVWSSLGPQLSNSLRELWTRMPALRCAARHACLGWPCAVSCMQPPSIHHPSSRTHGSHPQRRRQQWAPRVCVHEPGHDDARASKPGSLHKSACDCQVHGPMRISPTNNDQKPPVSWGQLASGALAPAAQPGGDGLRVRQAGRSGQRQPRFTPRQGQPDQEGPAEATNRILGYSWLTKSPRAARALFPGRHLLGAAVSRSFGSTLGSA